MNSVNVNIAQNLRCMLQP